MTLKNPLIYSLGFKRLLFYKLETENKNILRKIKLKQYCSIFSHLKIPFAKLFYYSEFHSRDYKNNLYIIIDNIFKN